MHAENCTIGFLHLQEKKCRKERGWGSGWRVALPKGGVNFAACEETLSMDTKKEKVKQEQDWGRGSWKGKRNGSL